MVAGAYMARRSRRRWRSGSVYQRGTRWYVKLREKGEQQYGTQTYESRELALQALAPIIAESKQVGVGHRESRVSFPPLGVLATELLVRREIKHTRRRTTAERMRDPQRE